MAGSGRENADSALLLALAAGKPAAEAARAAGVSERTVWRRLEDAAFRAQVADARRRMVEQAIGQLADASTEAVATLRALLGAESETARLGAARSILELRTKLHESVEVEARLAALEEQLAQQAPMAALPARRRA